MDKQKFDLTSVSFSIDNDLNCLRFTGIVGYLDMPSDLPPNVQNGERGWKAVIDGQTARVESLIGQGIGVMWLSGREFIDHDPRFKVGVIDSVNVSDKQEIYVTGHLWEKDFPDVCNAIRENKGELGFSVEILTPKELEDVDVAGKHIVYKNVEFTGVAILYKERAAFQNTEIFMSRGVVVNEQEIQKITEAVTAAVTEKMNEKIGELAVQFSSLQEEMKAAKAEPQPEEKGEANAVIDAIKAEFSALAEALKQQKADDEAGEQAEQGARKTQVEFAADSKYSDKKDVSFSAIAKDETLSESDKWTKTLEAWNKTGKQGE